MIQERKETAARRVAISTGASRMETTWKAKELTWDKLADSLGQTGRTRETAPGLKLTAAGFEAGYYKKD